MAVGMRPVCDRIRVWTWTLRARRDAASAGRAASGDGGCRCRFWRAFSLTRPRDDGARPRPVCAPAGWRSTACSAASATAGACHSMRILSWAMRARARTASGIEQARLRTPWERRLLVELAGVLKRDRFPRDELPCRQLAADASPRGFAVCVDVSTMYRRCKDTFPTFRAGRVGSRARSGRRDDGRGVEIALFRGVAEAGSTQLWLVERMAISVVQLFGIRK